MTAAGAAAREQRIALLIQNDLYPDADPTKTGDEDAATLAALLKRSGFDVALVKNAGKQDMQAAIDGFVSRITPKTVALVYFKGIGIEASRLNYLIPVDAAIWSEADVRREGTSFDRLLAALDTHGAGVKLAIIDAARPNPFERRFRMVSAGLAPPSSPAGTLVIFAQALGKAAEPDPGPVSPFMRALVQQLQVARDAEAAFTRTREDVSGRSKGRELPWVSSTLATPFRLGPGLPDTTPATRPTAPTGAGHPGKPPEVASAAPAPTPPPNPTPAPAPTKPAAPTAPPPHAAPRPSTAAPTGPPPDPVQGKPPEVATATPTPPSGAKPVPHPVPAKLPAAPPPHAAPPQAATVPPPAPVQGKPPAASPSPKPSTPKPPAQKPPEVAPRPGSTFADCKRCPEMTVLAPATFQMGSGATPYDRPVHKVTIAKPFAIARTVVTRDEWALCIDERGCSFRLEGAADGHLPVVSVTWSDAAHYAGWLSRKTGKRYRLPTEAEWEYAAHGGTTTTFAWGDASGTGHANCTDCGNKSGKRAVEPVRTYPANGFGLFDMAGNVAEWLQDCWTLTYRDAPTDGSAAPVASCTMRGLRGGSFDTSSAYIKPTARFRDGAEARSASTGFRVARDVD